MIFLKFWNFENLFDAIVSHISDVSYLMGCTDLIYTSVLVITKEHVESSTSSGLSGLKIYILEKIFAFCYQSSWCNIFCNFYFIFNGCNRASKYLWRMKIILGAWLLWETSAKLFSPNRAILANFSASMYNGFYACNNGWSNLDISYSKGALNLVWRVNVNLRIWSDGLLLVCNQ